MSTNAAHYKRDTMFPPDLPLEEKVRVLEDRLIGLYSHILLIGERAQRLELENPTLVRIHRLELAVRDLQAAPRQGPS